jgi:hypothetical protein
VKILSPEGEVVGARRTLAAPLPVLAGAKVAVLDNGKPNARLLLQTIAQRLGARTGAQVALVTAKATAATPAEPEIIQELRAADLVLTGSAD